MADTKEPTDRPALLARITELEVKVAFQEHQLAELDDVIRQLRDQLDTLTREVSELREQMPETDEEKWQKPPHY